MLKKKLSLSLLVICLLPVFAFSQDLGQAITNTRTSLEAIVTPLKLLVRAFAGIIAIYYVAQLYAKIKSGNQQVAKELGVFAVSIIIFFGATALVESAFGV